MGSRFQRLVNPFPVSGDSFVDRLVRLVIRSRARVIAEELLQQHVVFGLKDRLHLAPSAVVNNAVFNTASGHITIGDWVMIAHGVYLATGHHETNRLGSERQGAVPPDGRDIVVEEGAWLATNVTVLGPCRIGRHAIVAAGAVVRSDVAPYTVVAGVPAQPVGVVPHRPPPQPKPGA